MNLGAAAANIELARSNGNSVIASTIGIERQVDDLLGKYFMPSDKSRLRLFFEHVLHADALTFMNKRRILLAIIKDEQYLKGKAIQTLDEGLASIMRRRNAFAHGDFVEKMDGTYLSYYSGGKREDRLDDEYWSRVEEIFIEVIQTISSLRPSFGFPQHKDSHSAVGIGCPTAPDTE